MRGGAARNTLSRLRLEVPFPQHEPFLRWLLDTSYYSRLAFPPPFPETLAALIDVRPLAAIGIEPEIRWIAGYLEHFAQELTGFCRLQRQFHEAFFEETTEAAQEVLEDIEHEFGVSNWLIRNRIGLLQETRGLEAQKAYFAQVRAETRQNSLATYLAYYVSVRNEPTVTPTGFREELARSQERLKGASEEAILFLRSELYPEGPLSLEASEAKLRHVQGTTVIDAYEGFIEVARSLCASLALDGSPGPLSTSGSSMRRQVVELGYGT